MFKKLLLIGVLSVSLVGLFGTQASAYPPTLGGVSFCPWCPGNSDWIYISTRLVGIANGDAVPTDAYIEWIITDGEVKSFNPAGEDGGLGVHFNYLPFPISGSESSGDQTPVSGRGRWDHTFAWDYDVLIDYFISIGVLEPLPNPNWYYQLIIRRILVRITANTDVSEICEGVDPYPTSSPVYPGYPTDPEEQCTAPLNEDGEPVGPLDYEEVVHGIYECIAPADGDDLIYDETDDCDQLFLWKYKENSPLCEYRDPNRDDQPCVYDFPPDFEWWTLAPDDYPVP
jgi:hypothetical protein